VNKVAINLENEKKFNITAENLSEKNIYIKEVWLNGKSIDRSYLTHKEIINGGELKFVMQSEPNKKWAVDENSLQYSMTK
jgi:putative alpha-1,2-mannosidase